MSRPIQNFETYESRANVNKSIANIIEKLNTHTHTWNDINGKPTTFPPSSHGNHVPGVETANNARFLRNDNTWQTVTPANIGAAASSHGNHVPATCTIINDWNTATSTGWYMGSNASNAPTSGGWYMGCVIAHNTNYVYQEIYQFTASSEAKYIPKFIRAKTNSTWGSWTNVTIAKALSEDSKLSDTPYTHPNSGVTAGTYRSVTVNAQGHVTAGSNPTITVAQGGTGANNAATARTNLGITPSNIGAANSDHTHSYLPLSGGTMSGNIEMGSNAVYLDGYSTHGLKYGNKDFSNTPLYNHEFMHNDGLIIGDISEYGNGDYIILGEDALTRGYLKVGDYLSVGSDSNLYGYVHLGSPGIIESGNTRAVDGNTVYNAIKNFENTTCVFKGYWYSNGIANDDGTTHMFILDIPQDLINYTSDNIGKNISGYGTKVNDSSYMREYIKVKIYGALDNIIFFEEVAISHDASIYYSGGTTLGGSGIITIPVQYINIYSSLSIAGFVIIRFYNSNVIRIYSTNKVLSIFEISIS